MVFLFIRQGLELTFGVAESSAASSGQCTDATSYNLFHMLTDLFCGVGC